MKKKLIIAFNYEPYDNPRAIRWGNILNYVTKKKIEIDLVTYKNSNKSNNKKLIIHGHENLYANKFLKKNKNIVKANKNFILLKSLLIKILLGASKLISKFFIWPDYAFFSIYPFYKTSLKVISKKKINHIITVSHPFSCHIVGLLVKRKYPNITWDVDCSDPFSLLKEPKPNNVYIYQILNYFFEKKVLTNCRRFFVNNIQTKKLYETKFKKFTNKIRISQPLCLISPKKKRIKKFDSKKFKIVYAGAFYNKLREPNMFLYTMHELVKRYPLIRKNIKIYIFSNSQVFKNELQNFFHLKPYIFLYDQINYKSYQKFITTEKFFVNIGNKNNIQVPSKLYELIGKSVKILNFHHNIDKTTKRILKDYPFHHNINVDEDINFESIYRFITQKIEINFTTKDFKKKYTNNTIKKIAKDYFN